MPFLVKSMAKISRVCFRRRGETSRSMPRVIDDGLTGERKFSKRKRVAKSKSGKDIMNYFRSDDIESTSPT